MKHYQLKITTLLILSLLIWSCSKEEDGIYFESSNKIKVEYSKIELEILKLINDYRSTKDLPSLMKMNIISTVAKSHTNYMVEINQVNHDHFSERYEKLVTEVNAKIVGENVAYGYNSAQGVVNSWIKSTEHRALLENEKYTHFGISTEQNSKARNFFTQMFIQK